MDIVLIILITALLVFLLQRDNRRNGPAEPYWSHGFDRDVERVRADLIVGADALSRRPLRRAEQISSDWEPRA